MMINVIFDIDGVLIDVRRSFHDTIKNTVTYYLRECLNIPVQRQALSEEDIQLFKSVGGFNDDWDLTAGVLYYFVSLLPKIDEIDFKGKDLISLKNSLQKQVNVRRDVFQKVNIDGFVRKIRGMGLPAVLKATGGKNKHLVLYDGDLLKTNLVKRIFQEIYWGVDKFPEVYKTKNLFYNKPGKIHKEILIMDESILKNLYERKNVVLSIVTGREKRDAEYTLDKYDIKKYFKQIVTLLDVKDDKQKKPDPYCLILADKKMKDKFDITKRYYIGDQIDDVMMANSAK
ncbi:HAD hydrolase-like protein, partial [bacterium]|nr:HAD hydrolase-like protein [bacterium]